jgi:diaminopimelate epimerase
MIKFCKFEGFGNDYVVIESEQLKDISSIPEFTKSFCNRTHGVGSDGIAILEKLHDADADFSCRIINPDGSEAGFSGNGTRCAVAYSHFKGLWSEKIIRLKTLSGVKKYELLERNGKTFWFDAEIGKPKFASDEIPFASETKLDSVIEQPLTVDGNTFRVSTINVGNPVVCVFVENFDFDWRQLGKKLEVHEKFPEKTNVIFLKVLDRKNLEIKIWERGAGETSASGTCSTAAAILCAFANKSEREVSIHSEGGITEIVWREDGEMLIKGRADFVFSGEY